MKFSNAPKSVANGNFAEFGCTIKNKSNGVSNNMLCFVYMLKSPSNTVTYITTPSRRQSKALILSTNVDQKSLETKFLIAICHPTGDKWQPKTLFLEIFDPCLSIVKSDFECPLPGVITAR